MIIVSSLWQADDAIRDFNVRHVISLNDPGSVPPPMLSISKANRICVEFHDVTKETTNQIAPTIEDIETIISFGRGVLDGGDPVLIHCVAGVSRSTAAGLILAASYNKVEPDELVKLLRCKAPYSQPNTLMVQLGDSSLGLNYYT
jgi:predicted protein tyrosine phosphatase